MGDNWNDVYVTHELKRILGLEGLGEQDSNSATQVDGSWDFNADQEDSKRPVVRKKPRPRASDEMAQRIMDTLCQNGQGDFLLLQDDEIREWWNGVTAERERIAQREAEKRRREELREHALSKLTAEERQVLGIK